MSQKLPLHAQCLGAFAKLRKATISFVMSFCQFVRPSAWNNPIFMKFHIFIFFENLSRKSKFHWNLTRITETLHENLCTGMIISPWIILRMRNVSYWRCREYQKTFLRYSQQGHRWQYNTAHALCVLDNYDYRHTQSTLYLLLFHKNGYANALLLRYTYIASLCYYRF